MIKMTTGTWKFSSVGMMFNTLLIDVVCMISKIAVVSRSTCIPGTVAEAFELATDMVNQEVPTDAGSSA